MAGDGVLLTVRLGRGTTLPQVGVPAPLLAWETGDRSEHGWSRDTSKTGNVSSTTLPLCAFAFLCVIAPGLQPWAKVLRAAQGGQDRGGLQ